MNRDVEHLKMLSIFHYIVAAITAISCIVTPFGTALGIFTLIVLNRPSAKPLFGLNNAIETVMR
jgi:hypothetical protein